METGMIVEKQELFFLLSCRGCRNCPSVFEPEIKERPEMVLKSLFGKGWVTNTGERFQVEKPLAEAVGQITKAERLLCLCHGNRERELLYLYPGSRILAVQESFRRKNCLRLLYPDRKGLQQYLEEQGLLDTKQGWEPLSYADETMRLLPKQMVKRSDLASFPWICLLAEVLDGQTGQKSGAVGIIRKGFQEEIVLEDRMDEHMETEPYTPERFMERLLERIGETGWAGQPEKGGERE